ncbi:MAG: ABC transporter ATP-binding protein [Epsilonproteobacteria bacterium]|nr:MAG: ABC transporter ATP-binding protein [Campylobacterota bacterium]
MKLLTCNNLDAFYGDFQALFGIDFYLNKGETVAIIGSNGASKSTFLKSIMGIIPVRKDAIVYENKSIGGESTHSINRRGITLVPEGRKLFPSLNVEENLLIGTQSQREGTWNLESIYKLFPILKEKRLIPSSSLSGGQQQMVAIGRGLMSNPSILMLDEVSLGLAPVIVKDIYKVLPLIKKEGTTILLVEQDIKQALSVSDRVYCFQEGKISLEGKPRDLNHDQISQAYFGV